MVKFIVLLTVLLVFLYMVEIQACTSDGGSCSKDKDCCSKQCESTYRDGRDARCIKVIDEDTCTKENETCTFSYECCSRECYYDENRVGRCDEGEYVECVSRDQVCRRHEDCCSQNCGFATLNRYCL